MEPEQRSSNALTVGFATSACCARSVSLRTIMQNGSPYGILRNGVMDVFCSVLEISDSISWEKILLVF